MIISVKTIQSKAYQAMSSTARHTYQILACFADQSGYCFPTIPTIAETVGKSTRSIERAIAELATAKFVEITGTSGKRNQYRVAEVLPITTILDSLSTKYTEYTKCAISAKQPLPPTKPTATPDKTDSDPRQNRQSPYSNASGIEQTNRTNHIISPKPQDGEIFRCSTETNQNPSGTFERFLSFFPQEKLVKMPNSTRNLWESLSPSDQKDIFTLLPEMIAAKGGARYLQSPRFFLECRDWEEYKPKSYTFDAESWNRKQARAKAESEKIAQERTKSQQLGIMLETYKALSDDAKSPYRAAVCMKDPNTPDFLIDTQAGVLFATEKLEVARA